MFYCQIGHTLHPSKEALGGCLLHSRREHQPEGSTLSFLVVPLYGRCVDNGTTRNHLDRLEWIAMKTKALNLLAGIILALYVIGGTAVMAVVLVANFR